VLAVALEHSRIGEYLEADAQQDMAIPNLEYTSKNILPATMQDIGRSQKLITNYGMKKTKQKHSPSMVVKGSHLVVRIREYPPSLG
jgi:hypothetical protein